VGVCRFKYNSGANTAGISSLTAKMATKDDVITASVVADLSREFDVMPSHHIDWFQVN